MLIYLFRILFITVICTVHALLVHGQTDEVLSLNNEGLGLFGNDSFADALEKFEKSLSLQLKDSLADEEILARTYRNMGMCQLRLSLLHSAEQNLNEGINRYRKLTMQDSLFDNIQNRIGISHKERANVLQQKGEYKNATDDVNTAFDIFDKTGSRHSVTALNLLANIQIDESKFILAEETCHRAGRYLSYISTY